METNEIKLNEYTTIEVFVTHVIIVSDDVTNYIPIKLIDSLKKDKNDTKLEINNTVRLFDKKEDRNEAFDRIHFAKRSLIITEDEIKSKVWE